MHFHGYTGALSSLPLCQHALRFPQFNSPKVFIGSVGLYPSLHLWRLIHKTTGEQGETPLSQHGFHWNCPHFCTLAASSEDAGLHRFPLWLSLKPDHFFLTLTSLLLSSHPPSFHYLYTHTLRFPNRYPSTIVTQSSGAQGTYTVNTTSIQECWDVFWTPKRGQKEVT